MPETERGFCSEIVSIWNFPAGFLSLHRFDNKSFFIKCFRALLAVTVSKVFLIFATDLLFLEN